MTIGMAWVGRRADGREYLWMAADSRTRGSFVLDSSPKIMPLARSDCAICFAGDTAASYPLMMQLTTAIAAHQPARERSLDIGHLKEHLLRVFTGIIESVGDRADPFQPSDAQFLFGGYSWRSRSFQLWTIYYEAKRCAFAARPAKTFHPRLPQAAFIGDRAKDARARLARLLAEEPTDTTINLQPLRVLVHMLRAAKPVDTIGGAPQILRVTAHMNTRPLCVKWDHDEITLFGRKLFEYENCDYWIIDPDTLTIDRPRKFGLR